ncbi:MAG: hypothetical protein AAF466_09330 [Bacteroidota bacterium]
MKPNNPHNLPNGVYLKDQLDTDIGTIYFYPNIVIVEAHEGVTINYKTAFSILLRGLQITGFKPVVYISNRINSYSVDPNDYKYLNKISSLKAIAIVSKLESARQNAKLEKEFSKKDLEIFEDLNDAYLWAMAKLGKTPVTTKNGTANSTSVDMGIRQESASGERGKTAI